MGMQGEPTREHEGQGIANETAEMGRRLLLRANCFDRRERPHARSSAVGPSLFAAKVTAVADFLPVLQRGLGQAMDQVGSRSAAFIAVYSA